MVIYGDHRIPEEYGGHSQALTIRTLAEEVQELLERFDGDTEERFGGRCLNYHIIRYIV